MPLFLCVCVCVCVCVCACACACVCVCECERVWECLDSRKMLVSPSHSILQHCITAKVKGGIGLRHFFLENLDRYYSNKCLEKSHVSLWQPLEKSIKENGPNLFFFTNQKRKVELKRWQLFKFPWVSFVPANHFLHICSIFNSSSFIH